MDESAVPLPCDGTPVMIVWQVIAIYLLLYGTPCVWCEMLTERRLLLLAVLGPAAAVAMLAALDPNASCDEALEWAVVGAFATWFLNTAALFLGTVGVICGAAAVVVATPVHDGVMAVSLTFAALVVGVYHRVDCAIWENILPTLLGAWLLSASFAPMAGATRRVAAFAFVLLIAIGATAQWYRYKNLDPEIVRSLQGGEYNKRYKMLNDIVNETGDLSIDVRKYRDQFGSHLRDPEAVPLSEEERAKLTDDERSLLDACRKDPETRERVVYGGGFY
jgi:hypothetical protein